MILYYLGKYLFFIYFKIINRVAIHGKENIPKDGSILLCSNHIHNLDPPLVGTTFPRPVRFMAKAELFKIPVLGKLVKWVHAFPVRRGMSDRQAIRQGLEVLKTNQVLGIFPEGTRSKTGELRKGLAGVGFFALKSKAYVTPAAVIGSYLPFKKINIYYGKPIDFTSAREQKISAEQATEMIMDAIQELLDEHK